MGAVLFAGGCSVLVDGLLSELDDLNNDKVRGHRRNGEEGINCILLPGWAEARALRGCRSAHISRNLATKFLFDARVICSGVCQTHTYVHR